MKKIIFLILILTGMVSNYAGFNLSNFIQKKIEESLSKPAERITDNLEVILSSVESMINEIKPSLKSALNLSGKDLAQNIFQINGMFFKSLKEFNDYLLKILDDLKVIQSNLPICGLDIVINESEAKIKGIKAKVEESLIPLNNNILDKFIGG